MDVAAASQEDPGQGFPRANTLCLLDRVQNVDKRHPSHRHRKSVANHHATQMAMVTGQHPSPWHARQPRRLPPSRDATPASRLNAPWR